MEGVTYGMRGEVAPAPTATIYTLHTSPEDAVL